MALPLREAKAGEVQGVQALLRSVSISGWCCWASALLCVGWGGGKHSHGDWSGFALNGDVQNPWFGQWWDQCVALPLKMERRCLCLFQPRKTPDSFMSHLHTISQVLNGILRMPQSPLNPAEFLLVRESRPEFVFPYISITCHKRGAACPRLTLGWIKRSIRFVYIIYL